MKRTLPELSVRRLVHYSRFVLDQLARHADRILSEDIARHFNQDPSQVRKDLSWVGQLGKRGRGYDPLKLRDDLAAALLLDRPLEAVLVGCGRLGSALLGYPILKEFHFDIVRGFDTDPRLFDQKINGIPVDDYNRMGDFLTANKVKTAILAVPGERAREVADNLVRHGIRGILNFAPVFLNTEGKALVRNVDFSVDFNIFRYQMFKEKGL
jgi:redox-sensing transcriptional repressor